MPKLGFFALLLALALPTLACGNRESLQPVGACSATANLPSNSPIHFGQTAVDKALAEVHSAATVRILLSDDPCAGPLLAASRTTLADTPESFVAFASGSETVVVGRDPTGAMYGALEVAERVHGGDPLPLTAPITGTPDMAIRAANFMMVLPLQGEANADWWFYDEMFWVEYLEMMAHARLNILDLHGMYGLESTLFPNAMLYFASSPTFPDVGAPRAERDKNVAMLRKIVAMAAAHGIKVGFMTYRSDLTLDGSTPGPNLTDAEVGTYTKEAATDLARNVPDLWRIGFRIWESKHPASFYVDTFVAGLNESGTNVGLFSRSWGVAKGSMIDIANASNGPMVVEVKYNGEHLGPPYVITGGILSSPKGWWNYSYVDYLEPPDPYIFVFQVWSGGTHRLFRHASFDRIRRTVAGMKLGAAQGFTLMAAHAFFPAKDDYHATSGDRFSRWTFRRDELEYLMFGRLAYDPSTPESSFRRILARRTGTDSLWASVQAASDIVPWIQSVHTCGPDQRTFAPDLEWAGTVAYWASPAATKTPGSYCDSQYHGPYDTMAYAAPLETATDWVAGRGTSKLSSMEVAQIVLHDAALARAAASAPIDFGHAEARDVVRECTALADLGEYFAHKLRAATSLAVYGQSAQQGYLDAARAEIKKADDAWIALAKDTAHIAPFTETMRMSHVGLPVYHWSMIVPSLPEDPASIDSYAAAVVPPQPAVSVPPASTLLTDGKMEGPGLLSLEALAPVGSIQRVVVRFAKEPPKDAKLNVIWKEFSGLADWNSTPLVKDGDVYHADVPKGDRTGYFVVEVQGGRGVGWRYPDVRTGAPYVAVSPTH